MFKKVMNAVLSKIMRARGYSTYFASKVVKETFIDFKDIKSVSWKQKLWAYRKGFLSSNIARYGLSEENYKDFMPDFDYYKLHPINGQFSKWIDDKMTVKYILSPFNEYLPEYYFEIHKNKVIKLMDSPRKYDSNINSVVNLLESKGALAIKLISGSKGEGFYKVSYNNNKFYINDNVISDVEFNKFLLSLDGYLVTEYIMAHQNIRAVYPNTPNALRVGVLNNNGTAKVFGAFIRYGTEKSGMIEHAYAGGVFSGVNIIDGSQFNPKQYQGEKTIDVSRHPDTGAIIKGKVPHWELIKEVIEKIGSYVPQLKYMGFDIIITDNGFKILEINSHQSLVNMQVYYPIKKDKEIMGFFNKIRKNN